MSEGPSYALIGLLFGLLGWGLSLAFNGAQTENSCKEQCRPYQYRLVEDQCECMDSEGRWVPQEVDDG